MSLSTHNQVVVLTGSIGSGKSTVGELLNEFGAVVISADQLAREAVEPGSEALEQIVDYFGEEICDKDGFLDRAQLGQRIFSDPEQRHKLEQITHPIIAKLASERFEQALVQQAPLVVYECPLFFEVGLDRQNYRAVIVVATDEKTALQRIVARDGMSEEQARARLEAQLPLAEKREKADYLIDNSGSLEDLRKQVEELYRELIA